MRMLMRGVAMLALAMGIGCASAAGSAHTSDVLTDGERDVLSAVLDTLSRTWQDADALCLSIMGQSSGPVAADDALLRRIASRREIKRDCPPVSVGMRTTLSAPGRPVVAPPGASQWHRVLLGRPQYEAQGYAWVHVREERAGMGRAHLCNVQLRTAGTYVFCEGLAVWNY